jgi:hypothetical protein
MATRANVFIKLILKSPSPNQESTSDRLDEILPGTMTLTGRLSPGLRVPVARQGGTSYLGGRFRKDQMMTLSSFARPLGLCLAGFVLISCGRQDLDEPPVDLGPFKLGLNIVVADNMQKVPISRDATVEEWETGLKKAVQDRFGRYDGDRFYNIGINVDGYALAPPGIPVVAAPKSVVVVTANIWDDASATRLNKEPKQFTVFENLSGDTVLGSGFTKTKEEQLAALSYNVAQTIEGWFMQNPQWFAASGAIPGDNPNATPLESQPTLVSGTPESRRAAAAASAAPAAPAAAPVAVETVPLGMAPPAATATGELIRPVARPPAAAPAN